MITAIFLGFVFYGVYQFMLALNDVAVAGDHLFDDKPRLKKVLMMIAIPLGIAVVIWMFFKSKIKFK